MSSAASTTLQMLIMMLMMAIYISIFDDVIHHQYCRRSTLYDDIADYLVFQTMMMSLSEPKLDFGSPVNQQQQNVMQYLLSSNSSASQDKLQWKCHLPRLDAILYTLVSKPQSWPGLLQGSYNPANSWSGKTALQLSTVNCHYSHSPVQSIQR